MDDSYNYKVEIKSCDKKEHFVVIQSFSVVEESGYRIFFWLMKKKEKSNSKGIL